MSHLLNESPRLSRRTVLAGAILTGGALALGGAAVFGSRGAFAAVASTADFLRLSEFLTGGQPLAAGLAARFQAALGRRDAGFNDNVQSLQAYVDAAKAPSIDNLLARPDLTEPLRKTITQIVSAWYLGIVGDDDKTELVSYAQALMYRPTQDVLVIPTYGGGPDSWGEKPTQATPAPTSTPTNEKQAA